MKIVVLIISLVAAFSGVWSETEAETALRHYGGITAFYEVQTEEDDFAAVLEAGEDILRSRLDNHSYSQAEIELLGNDLLKVTAPGADSIDELAFLTESAANLEFLDSSGNVVLNSNHISGAYANFGPINGVSQSEYHVVVEFTMEGRELFAKATEKAASLADIGENYIDIEVDGMNVSHASVNEAIVSDTVTISGEFDEDSATQLATLIDSSRYSMGFVLVDSKYTEPAEG